jgi:hypothetical protein
MGCLRLPQARQVSSNRVIRSCMAISSWNGSHFTMVIPATSEKDGRLFEGTN